MSTKNLYAKLFVKALCIIAKKFLEKLKFLSTKDGLKIKKMWGTHTMKYYLGIKGNKVLIYATIGTNFDNTMLHKNHLQKAICWIILYMRGPEETNA